MSYVAIVISVKFYTWKLIQENYRKEFAKQIPIVFSSRRERVGGFTISRIYTQFLTERKLRRLENLREITFLGKTQFLDSIEEIQRYHRNRKRKCKILL